MLMKLWYKGKRFLWNDFGILKLITTLCFLSLLIDEIYVCVVKKPTLTTNVKEDLSKEDFPSVTLCPGPSIDYDELHSRGYIDIWEYKSGLRLSSGKDVKIIGWTGNKSETMPEVSSAISVLKSVLDCPETNSSSVWWGRNKYNKDDKGSLHKKKCDICHTLGPGVLRYFFYTF